MFSRARSGSCLLALFALGCVVSPPDLTAETFSCTSDQDCIDDWTCADIGLLGPDVCRPACDPNNPTGSCPDGYCSSSGVCWDTCRIASDGALDRPCRAGLTCIRRNGFDGDGLCMPAAGCSVSTDCAGPYRDCANEVFHLPASDGTSPFSADHSFCIATPQGEMLDRCPPGSFANNGICIPSCDQDNDRCPPGMACVKGLGSALGAAGRSACLFGVRGLPCRDDSECFEGRCLAQADGRRACTFTCDQAAMAGPQGCDILDGYSIAGFGGLDFECDAAGVCAARGAVGAPCNSAMPCHDELQCNAGSPICTTLCMPSHASADCIVSSIDAVHVRQDVYCAEVSAGSGGTVVHFCLNQRGNGASCTTNAECVSGRCASNRCVVPLPR